MNILYKFCDPSIACALLGANEIDSGADNLLKISHEFEADPKAKKPVSLYVI